MTKISWLTKFIIPIAILFLTVLVGKLYFHSGFPYTHDGENHLARFANYKVALKEGQFPPRLAPNLMNHYGYPVFNYNYPLANIASIPFSLIKLNYQLTFKLLTLTALLVGLVGIWYWQYLLGIKSKLALITGVTAAGTSPFVISMLYFRGNIGELLAWALLPWLFAFGMDSRKEVPKWQQALHAGLWMAFFLSHNVTVLYATPILLAWLILNHGKTMSLARQLRSWGVGVLSSLWFWLPAIIEKSEVILDNAGLSSGYADHFSTLNQLFLSPLEFGFSRVGSIDSLSLSLGLAAIIGLVGWFILVLKNKNQTKQPKQIYFLLVVALGCIIFQLQITQLIWEQLPFVRFIQFPWRLTLLFSLLTSVLLSAYFAKAQRIIQTIILAILIIQLVTVSKAKPVDYFSKQIIDYDLFAQSTTTANENLPKKFTYESFAASWKPEPELIPSTGKKSVLSWTGSKRQYTVEVTEDTLVIEPTMAFLGWRTTVEDQTNMSNTNVSYLNNAEIAGRLAYQLPAGSYFVTTSFTQLTPARLLGNSTSLLAIVITILWVVVPTKKNIPNEKAK